jgi:GTPase KRas protein
LEWFPIVVVGNKFDLGEEREVSYEEGINFCSNREIQFFETSSKTRLNIDETFHAAIRLHLRIEKKEKKDY